MVRCLTLSLVVAFVFLSARPVVPVFMLAQRQTIVASAEAHNLSPDVLAAVLYNEMLGQEHRFLMSLIPGDHTLAAALRDSLLGWHFLTLKQAQWAIKGAIALAGSNTTVGPTGIRVSVGREIRSEVPVHGGSYQPSGLAERPSLVLDLTRPASAIEYLAANLQRGVQRATPDQVGDWTICARWHNTGLTADRPDVPRPVWDKGTNYVARVETFLPQMRAMIHQPADPPVWRVMSPDQSPLAGHTQEIAHSGRQTTIMVGAQ